MKSAFIAILGRPNVGKSSLMNALIGQKASIVSPRSQTTRSKILGILTMEEHQLVFVDTPGIFKPKNKLDEYMERTIKQAEKDVDAILFVIDVEKGISQKERELISAYSKTAPLYLIANKVDAVGFDKIYPFLQEISPFLEEVEDIIAVSARTGENVQLIKERLIKHATDENQYFDRDDYTDKPLSFMAAEIIREKTLWRLNEEIPHGIGISLLSFKDEEKIVRIEADIICEKDNHKRIIIGKNGEKIKEIGTLARLEIEKLVDKKVFLALFVKVRENWRNNQGIVSDLGYSKNK